MLLFFFISVIVRKKIMIKWLVDALSFLKENFSEEDAHL